MLARRNRFSRRFQGAIHGGRKVHVSCDDGDDTCGLPDEREIEEREAFAHATNETLRLLKAFTRAHGVSLCASTSVVSPMNWKEYPQ